MADTIKIRLVADSGEVIEMLGQTNEQAKGLGDSLDKAGRSGAQAGEQIADGMRKAEYSAMEARHAAMLLGEETGVKIPRALAGIAARSETLGPLLAGAFSGVALIAFAELAVKATEKLTDWIAKTFIFTDAMKALDSINKGINADIVDQEAKLKGLQEAYELIGLTGSALSAKKFELFNADQLAPAQKLLTDMQGSIGFISKGFADTGQAVQIVNNYISQFNKSLPKDQQMSLLPDSASEAKALDTLRSLAVAYQHNITTLAQEGANQQKKYELEVADEADKAAKKRLEIEEKVDKEISSAHAALQKEMAKQTEENSKIVDDQLKRQLDGKLKAAEASEKEAAATVKAAEAQLELNSATAKAAAVSEADAVARDKAAGHIRQAMQDEQKLIALLQQEKAAALAVVDAKIQGAQVQMAAADTSTPEGATQYQTALAAYRQFQAQRVQIAAEADKKITAADDADLKQQTKSYQTYLNTFNSQFANSFAQVMMGHETLGKAAVKMYQQMTQALLTNLAKAAMADIEGALLHKTLAKEQQLDDAKNAAGGAWKALSGIPIIGPALGAAAAAVAFAGVMAFDEGGMSEGGLSLLHPNEAVLNPEQTKNFQQMTESGGGDTHNYGDLHIHATDSDSIKKLFKNNPAALSAGIMHAVRNGHLSASQIARGK
jgi:hypothetical protein